MDYSMGFKQQCRKQNAFLRFEMHEVSFKTS